MREMINALAAILHFLLAFHAAIILAVAVSITVAVQEARRSRQPEFTDGLIGGLLGGVVGGAAGYLVCAPLYNIRISFWALTTVGLLEGAVLGAASGIVFAWRAAARSRAGHRQPAI